MLRRSQLKRARAEARTRFLCHRFSGLREREHHGSGESDLVIQFDRDASCFTRCDRCPRHESRRSRRVPDPSTTKLLRIPLLRTYRLIRGRCDSAPGSGCSAPLHGSLKPSRRSLRTHGVPPSRCLNHGSRFSRSPRAGAGRAPPTGMFGSSIP